VTLNKFPKAVKAMRNEILTDGELKFQAYGVRVSLKAENPLILNEMRRQLAKIFTNGFEKMTDDKIEHQFIVKSKTGEATEFYHNGEKLFEGETGEFFYEACESRIRVTIAEFAVGKVFLHAGVVGWKNRAIIIPAQSWSGKTTLVAELVKKGALYYSDEYAVLDEHGNVEPFPKWLSVRGVVSENQQTDISVESLGGVAGTKTIRAGMILIATFDRTQVKPGAEQPQRLTAGQGIMEILPHTLPIRNSPKFVLEVLNKIASRAIIVKTVRGEAKDFAGWLLNYFENQAD
jgi:hypothetical protein